MYPGRWFFHSHPDQPTTEVAIRRGFAEDLYIVMAQADAADQSASMEIVVNPLVNWVWVGFGIMGLGIGIAMLPEYVFAFAGARFPAGAVTTSLMLLLALLLGQAGLSAHQHEHQVPVGDGVPSTQRTSPLAREVGQGLMCICGDAGCVRKRIGECECGEAAHEREVIAGMVKEGKTKQEIFEYYIAKFGGQHVLAEPIDEGFNRLAWFVPYAVGVLGFGMVAWTARRWTRQPRAAHAAAGDGTLDAELNDRLDDELRNID